MRAYIALEPGGSRVVIDGVPGPIYDGADDLVTGGRQYGPFVIEGDKEFRAIATRPPGPEFVEVGVKIR